MPFGAHIFGVVAMTEPAALGEVAHLAEHPGYHSVFCADHMCHASWSRSLRRSSSPISEDAERT